MEVERKWRESEVKSLWNPKTEAEITTLDKIHGLERLEYENRSNSMMDCTERL
jgi:hypothetical protein